MGILNNNQPQPMYTEEDMLQMQQQMKAQYEQEYQQGNASMQASKLPVSQEFHILRINFDDDIQDFQMWLRGYTPTFDDKGVKQYKETHDKIMNEKGCNRITSVVSAFLKKSIILGCLEGEQVLMKMNYFMKQLAHLIALNSYSWELDRTEKTMLVWEVTSLVHSTLTRSLDGNEADQLSTAISRVESVQQHGTPPQQGMSLGRAMSLFQR